MVTWVGAHPTMDDILRVNPMHTSENSPFSRVRGDTNEEQLY